MKTPQNRWTVDFLASLPDDELDRIGRKVAGQQSVSNLITGRVMMAMERTSLPERRGLSGPVHYFALEGRERKDALECLRVARKCETLPLIREAAETGTIGWTYLREIVRVASPETEATWLDLCSRLSSGKVQQLVKYTNVGEDPLKAAASADHQHGETSLRVTLSAEVNALLAQVVRELSRRAGKPLSMRAVLECLVAQHLTGTPFPDEAAWNKLTDQARRDLTAQRERERRQIEEIRERENSQEFCEAPWAAVAADEEPCPGEPELGLVVPAPAHWENERLRFNGESRHLTEAQRREILRRDGYCCATPDCPNHLWLQVHHLVYYCQGGVTIPDNLLVLRSRCHSRVHKGRLRVQRQPDGTLRWSDGRGRSLTDNKPEGWLEDLDVHAPGD